MMSHSHRQVRLPHRTLGLFMLALACAERTLPIDDADLRIYCTPIGPEVMLDDGSVEQLPAPLKPEQFCLCFSSEKMADWEFRTEVVNELAYERCIEMVRSYGYDPADSDCDWKRTFEGYGWWALSLGAPPGGMLGDPNPPCSEEEAGCSVKSSRGRDRAITE